MSFEKQEVDKNQENKEKFDKSFEKDLENPEFDKKAFADLIS
jgi:hypothetical protein